MARTVAIEPQNDRELAMCRIVAASPEAIWRCWADAELLKQWFCPKPWTVPRAEVDLSPGGISIAEMQGPAGEQSVHRGVFLEAVPHSRIVFTDAFHPAWQPTEKPFMVATLTLEPHPDGTLYTVRVGHWSVEDRVRHEEMGFFEGWGLVIDQLEEVASRLP